MKKTLSLSLVAAFLLAACGGAASFKADDAVLLDWAGDSYSWHKAKLTAECGEAEEAGWNVDFADDFYDGEKGDEPICFAAAQILRDTPLSEGDVKAGDTVLAEWVESFYRAEVKTVADGKYSVIFEDGIEDELEVDKLRAAPAEKKAE